MAWNQIPAKSDPNLRLEVYYLRVNVLGRLLSPFSFDLFQKAWDYMADSSLAGLRRSRMSGKFLADLVRALALDEIEEVEFPESGWFVHSGVTVYGPLEDGMRSATIHLQGGRILHSTVRSDCEITTTARSNMRGEDDISFVVGRLLGGTNFDLIAAGYRSPVGLTLDRAASEVETFRSMEAAAYAFDESDMFPKFVHFEGDQKALQGAVDDAVNHFSRQIRALGGWKVLYGDNGQPVHETVHQIVFCLFAAMSFNMMNIKMHPGANHGSGPTDITLTLRNATHIIEFKKDVDRSKVRHGLEVQLPLYMESAGAAHGSYVVLCHNYDPEYVSKWLPPAEGTPAGVLVFLVDCRVRKSASKA